MPYADSAVAQTGANEATKGRIRPIKAYPTLWPTVVLVVIGYLRLGGHLLSNVSVRVCVLVVLGWLTTAELSRTRGSLIWGEKGTNAAVAMMKVTDN